MITFAILNILIVFLYRKNNITKKAFIITYSLATIFLTISLIGNNTESFFISDEIYYYELAKSYFTYQDEGDRYLWIKINQFILNYDLALNGFSLKIINLPIYILSLILLYELFNKDKRVLLIAIILPYFLWTATFNLRDTLIIATTISMFLLLKKESSPVYILILLVILYLLRPFAAFINFFIIFLFIFLQSISKLHIGKILLYSTILVAIGVSSFELLSSKFNSYQMWFEYTTDEGRDSHLESQEITTSEASFLTSVLRYIFTPIPTSLIDRILQGGSEQWGVFDDLVRLVHQTSVYFLILYLVINVKNIYRVLLKQSAAINLFLLSLMTYLPIYSFHLFGMTHTRSKLPLHIVLFLVSLLIYSYNKRRKQKT